MNLIGIGNAGMLAPSRGMEAFRGLADFGGLLDEATAGLQPDNGVAAVSAATVRAAAPPAMTAKAAGLSKLVDALKAFQAEAALTSRQRARRDVLKSMKLTEAIVRDMPEDVRKATELKIATEVAKRLDLKEPQFVPPFGEGAG